MYYYNKNKLKIAGLVEESIVDGPGIRFVVFTQGCPHDCKGCHNPQTHDFNLGEYINIDDLAKNKYRMILLNKCDLAEENVTVLWEKYYKQKGFAVMQLNALKGTGISQVTASARELMQEKIQKQKDDPGHKQ